MSLPKFLQPYLASYELSSLDVKRDRDLIVTEVLNKGDDKAVRWLGRVYSRDDIKQVVKNPVRGMWLENNLKYWLVIFDLNLSAKKLQDAVINLNAY